MPELPILDNQGRLASAAPIIVATIATYPDDEQARGEYLASLFVQLGGKVNSQEALAVVLGILHEAPSRSELQRQATRATENAWVASMALLIMLGTSIHHPEQRIDASRALWAVSQEYPNEVPSERTRWRIWGRFGRVAHLKLAIDSLLFAHGFSMKNLPPSPIEFLGANFIDYLGRAETICRLALERRFLFHGEVWRAPVGLEIPRVSVSIPAPPESVLAALASYVPAYSRDGIEE